MKEEKKSLKKWFKAALILKVPLQLLLTETLLSIFHNVSLSVPHTALYSPLCSASLWLLPAGGMHAIPAPCKEPI